MYIICVCVCVCVCDREREGVCVCEWVVVECHMSCVFGGIGLHSGLML